MSGSAPVVLVHGAFRGGWSWQRVRRRLQAADVETFTPSLTGAGERAHQLSASIGLDDWARDVASLLDAEDLRNVLLVGHSQGSIVIQAAAERVSERVAQLVFIDAPVLRDGEAAIDLTPPELLAQYGKPLRDSLVQPAPVSAESGFSPEDAAWFNARLSAAPVNPGLDIVRIARSASVPHHYVFCTRTAPHYPASHARRRLDDRGVAYELIDAPHDCIWTHADAVADILLRQRAALPD